MTAILRFDMTTLRPIIAHAIAAKEFRAGYESKPEPALFLVKDDGIYLMSAGLPMLRDPKHAGPSEKSLVAYAKGFENNAPDSWKRCRDAVGGDDFAETLPLAWFKDALHRGAVSITIRLSEQAIRLTSRFSRRAA